jgi:hypothetical protein
MKRSVSGKHHQHTNLVCDEGIEEQEWPRWARIGLQSIILIATETEMIARCGPCGYGLHAPFAALFVEACNSYSFNKITFQYPCRADKLGRDEDISVREPKPVRRHVRCFPKLATNVGARRLICGLDFDDPSSLAVLGMVLRKPDRNGIVDLGLPAME